jgi:hypothetical protein
MSKEAMKQALEVLKKPWKAGPDGVADAIIALEEALAKQGEPVGVVGMDVSRPGMSYQGQYLGQKPDNKIAFWFKDLEVGTKLYTTPQQRKPLTNKQLFEHWRVAKVVDMTEYEIDIGDYVLIARDVEALHGIKE